MSILVIQKKVQPVMTKKRMLVCEVGLSDFFFVSDFE